MRSVLTVAVLGGLVACGVDNSADDFPPRPGGGGGGGGGGVRGPDARQVDATPVVPGRVCVVSDLRRWDTGCAAVGYDNLTVTIGTATAMTTANGSFSISPPAGAGLRVVVTGAGIVPSNNPYDPTAVSIVAVAPTDAHWTDVQQGSGFLLVNGNGGAVIATRVSGALAAGVVAASAPAPSPGLVLYDSAASPTVWDVDMTDADGKALMYGYPAGNVVVTATTMGGLASAMVTVPIDADTLTFDTVNIIP